MAKNTKGDGSLEQNGVTVVTPDNMGKGVWYNPATKKYEVKIANNGAITINQKGELELELSKEPDNLLRIKDDGLYYGTKPALAKMYVDYNNGNDSNDGTIKHPFKTVWRALKEVKRGTAGTYIHLKENQRHYFTEGKNSQYNMIVAGSILIVPYGEKKTELEKAWLSDHTGTVTSEPIEASEEYAPYLPTLVFRGTTSELKNEAPLKMMEGFNVWEGVNAEIRGLIFDCEDTADVANSAGGWFTSAFRGKGEVVLSCCTMKQRDIERGHFYLANSTIGSLQVLCQRLTIAGTGNLWKVGQYPLKVFSSYEQSRAQERRSQGGMWYKATASAEEIFRLTTDNNPKSFITNK